MIGMLEMVVMFSCRPKYTSNVALSAGSSKHGKARRASVAWNCVTPMALGQKSDKQGPHLATSRDVLTQAQALSKTMRGRQNLRMSGKYNYMLSFHIQLHYKLFASLYMICYLCLIKCTYYI